MFIGPCNYFFFKIAVRVVMATFVAAPLHASMQALDEDEMAEVSGAGIAVALEDFSFSMAPTSFIELTGSDPTGDALAGGWRRGDARYYGLTISGGQTGAGTGINWQRNAGTSCNQNDTVGCPIGTQGASNFAPVYDPYVFRSFQYEGYDFQGVYRSGGNMPTILELIGPSNMDPWRWAFWGEIEAGRGSGTVDTLQSQSIIHGRNTTKDGTPTITRVVKTQNNADPTLGIMYQSALSGDFRFSVGQKAGTTNTRAEVPLFDPNEGLYFRDVDAYLPMGRLHSQALTLDTEGGDGNFSLTLTPIPNVPAVYNDIYCGIQSTSPSGCATNIESTDFFGRSVVAISNPNPQTHGYIRWGDFGRNFTAADNGIQFRPTTAGDALGHPTRHLGVARLDGVLIQYLKITTLGAGTP